MRTQICGSDEAVAACFPVMQQLRTHLDADAFLRCVREQEEQGYRLVALWQDGEVVAVAGFRIGSNLAWGRYLYVDDLVVDEAERSKGYGAVLLDWLRRHARESFCTQLHLDSGMAREDAHRFYEGQGMTKAGYHFVEVL